MNYHFNEEGLCLVVDLREENPNNRVYFEDILDRFKCLEQESYEDNLYHIYMNDEGDWETIKSLVSELDEMIMDLDIDELESNADFR